MLLSSATTSAQRAVKFTQEKVPVQQTVQLMGFRAQKSLLMSPGVALCALPARGFHTIIVSGPVTAAELEHTFPERACLSLKSTTDRGYCCCRLQLLKTCKGLFGDTHGKITHQTAYPETCIERCQEYHGSAFN